MLRVRALSGKQFGPIDFSVEAGRCIALIGPSGAGKTVLLRAIVDLDPNQGQVTWNGQDRRQISAPAWRRRIAFVPAETGWWADQVAAHIAPTETVNRYIDAVELPRDIIGWSVARLSTGERHRLGLVRALLQGPEVLLLDEPTAPLDGETTRAVEALLLDECARGTTVVLVTHDPAQVRRLASAVLTLRHGAIADFERLVE